MFEKIKVIKVNKETGKEKECLYPRGDRKPVEGDKTYIYYFIEQEEIPEYDSERQFIERVENRDNEKMICSRGWKIIDISKEDILKMLDSSVGSYLEENYPIWKRSRHNRQKINGSTSEERKAYIQGFYDFEDSILAEYDKRKKDLIENNIHPSFEWNKKSEV